MTQRVSKPPFDPRFLRWPLDNFDRFRDRFSLVTPLEGFVAGHEGKRSGLSLHTTLIDRILVSSEVVASGRMVCGRVSSLVDSVLFDRQTEVFGKAPEPFGDEGDGDEEQWWKLVQLVIRNIPCSESSNPMAHCRQPLTRDG